MTNNKQQTALSFFLMGLIDLEIGKGIPTDKVIELHYLFNKAKAMEKDQHIKSWEAGLMKVDFNEYYNKTYGDDKQ